MTDYEYQVQRLNFVKHWVDMKHTTMTLPEAIELVMTVDKSDKNDQFRIVQRLRAPGWDIIYTTEPAMADSIKYIDDDYEYPDE